MFLRRTTAITQAGTSGQKLEDFVGVKFYSLHALTNDS